MFISVLFSLWECYIGPILATRNGAKPYGTHAEPGCTPHMGPIWDPYRYVCWVFIRLEEWCMDSIFKVKNTPIVRKDESGLKI